MIDLQIIKPSNLFGNREKLLVALICVNEIAIILCLTFVFLFHLISTIIIFRISVFKFPFLFFF